MPMNENASVVEKENDSGVIKCSIKMLDAEKDTVDQLDRSQSTSSTTTQSPQPVPKSKKSRMSLTSFSIFRRDKKFSESKVDSPSSVGVVVAKADMAPQSTRRNNLVLDNTRLERRLQKELMAMIKEPPPGVTVDADSIGSNLSQWTIEMSGTEGTLYEGEKFQLLFKFNNKYPFDSPEVTFVGTNIPIHPHVYSNGHICLSILTDDWSPALSVPSVCLSISSMLSSCRDKKRPPDNTLYVKTCNKNPKKTKWWYHDDSV